MALAALGAALAFLAGVEAPSWRQARETAPLAAAVGGLLGFAAFPRYPRRPASGLRRGAAAAAAGLALFLLAYATTDALIESISRPGGSFSRAWTAAAGRVIANLWLAGPAALVFGALAGRLLTRPRAR